MRLHSRRLRRRGWLCRRGLLRRRPRRRRAFRLDRGDQPADGEGRARLDRHRGHRAGDRGRHLDGRLVGLDLQQGLVDGHRIPGGHQHPHDVGAFNALTQLRESDFCRQPSLSVRTAPVASPPALRAQPGNRRRRSFAPAKLRTPPQGRAAASDGRPTHPPGIRAAPRRRLLVARHVISFGQTNLSRTTYFFCIGLLRFEVNAPTILSLVVAMHWESAPQNGFRSDPTTNM